MLRIDNFTFQFLHDFNSYNMRKLAFYTMTICLLCTFSLSEVKAINSKANTAILAEKPVHEEEVQAMINRLEEIKAMDMAGLTTVQKKELRKEVRAIKSELRATSGIYISIGALLIIILLLILLL